MKLILGMRVAYKSPDDGSPQQGVIDHITNTKVFVFNDDDDIDDFPLPQANLDLEILHQEHNNPETYFDKNKNGGLYKIGTLKFPRTVLKDGCKFIFLRIATRAIDGENGFLYRQYSPTKYQDVITDSPLT